MNFLEQLEQLSPMTKPMLGTNCVSHYINQCGIGRLRCARRTGLETSSESNDKAKVIGTKSFSLYQSTV